MTSRGGLEELLAARPIFHIHWGLDRVEAVLAALGHPERSFRCIHFAGTNGKGSAAAACYAVLDAAGERTGLYTSPHLLDPRERMRASDPIPSELLDRCAERVRAPADEADATYFEAITAVALLAFAELGLEWAVLETGLGGRLDATNVVRPAASAIVTVALDHQAMLGPSLAAIAAEKAGILKPGVPTVLGRLPAEARVVIRNRAREVGAPLRVLGRDARWSRVRTSLAGTSFEYHPLAGGGPIPLRTPMIGAYQAHNAAVAILALEAAGVAPGPETLRQGLGATQLAGRFQLVRESETTWVLDIAHNPAAAAALREALATLQLPAPPLFVVGILADKDWRGILEALLRPGDLALLTIPPSAPASRRWDPVAAAAGSRQCRPVADFELALGRARELAGNRTVVVTGSAYMVADALVRLRGGTIDATRACSPSQDDREAGERRDDGVRSDAGAADARGAHVPGRP